MVTSVAGGNRLPLREQAFFAIKEQILTGEIAPGTVLSETKVADDLGMSRTPVREALVHLTNEGFARRFARRGVIVLELSMGDVLDVLEVQACLEQYALSQILGAGRQFDLDQLQALMILQREALDQNDTRLFLKLDRQMHQQIIDHLENQKLGQIMLNTSDMLVYGGYRALRSEQKMRDALAEHQILMQALSAGDLEGALTASKAHIASAKRRLIE